VVSNLCSSTFTQSNTATLSFSWNTPLIFHFFCTFYINSMISKLTKIHRLLVCKFCVSKCIHFSFYNLMGCSWNISSFSWNSAAVFDAWVRVLSDARISVIPITTNVSFLIGSLQLGNFIPALCCVYNKSNLISMVFLPEPCQTYVKWKLPSILGVLNFVHTLNTLTCSTSLTANWGSNQAKDTHPPVPLLEC